MCSLLDARAEASGVCDHAQGQRGRGRADAVAASARVDHHLGTRSVPLLRADAGGGRADADVRWVPRGQVCIPCNSLAARHRLPCLLCGEANSEAWMGEAGTATRRSYLELNKTTLHCTALLQVLQHGAPEAGVEWPI